MMTPIEAAARLTGRPGRVLLHSGVRADGTGRWSFVACEPATTIEARGRSIIVRDGRGEPQAQFQGDPLVVLDELASAAGAQLPAAPGSAPVPVAIGYVGYEFGSALLPRVPTAAPDPADLPDLWFGIYDAVWRHDAETGRSELCGRDRRAQTKLAAALSERRWVGPMPTLGELIAAPGVDAAYRIGFERLQQYIRDGDVYQVNLARRLSAVIREEGDPLAVYRRLSETSPACYGAMLETEQGAIVSGSPERFLYRAPGSSRLETRPIKGTRRRIGDPAIDASVAAGLPQDEKERAEHLMIVDLERNDLGRIAQLGSVRVEGFGRVVELPNLYHMVSTVACRVAGGVGVRDILRATFPGGSITGAPKIRAMQIIAELESCRRGVYTGSIGYIGQAGALDLSIAIRTATISRGELALMVGGGVVSDSTCARELEETEEKAAGWRRSVFGEV